MPTVSLVKRSGERLAVSVATGMKLMEGIRDAGEIEAVCGGQGVCATCHVHVSPEWFEIVGPPGDLEKELLDSSLERRPNSRLSCQIVMTDEMSGLEVAVAPAEG